MELAEIRQGLEAFVTSEMAAGSRLGEVCASDGHAGLTFLFDVDLGDGAVRSYVIKLPPRGVKRRGNTDVYRQAPLLRALRADGLPVPEVPWAYATDDNPWFALPFIVMERLPGATFFVLDPVAGLPCGEADCHRRWTQAVQVLARLHAFDWQEKLPQWEQPTALEYEITRWERIYAQAPESAWIAAAEKCERALLDTLPVGARTGLFHGDYQPGNCLYVEQSLVGVIDWELSGIGAQLLDLGWLLMMADPLVWTPGWTPRHPLPADEIRAIYADAAGHAALDRINWFQALANYRLASISCLNVKLHRKGQRHDPIWEHNARSVLPMFRRAIELTNA